MGKTKQIKAKIRIDYKHEATRHMCEGCNKAVDSTTFQCAMWNAGVIPAMYVRANECPHNPRKRKVVGGRKQLVGQQKQGRV